MLCKTGKRAYLDGGKRIGLAARQEEHAGHVPVIGDRNHKARQHACRRQTMHQRVVGCAVHRQDARLALFHDGMEQTRLLIAVERVLCIRLVNLWITCYQLQALVSTIDQRKFGGVE